MINESIQHNEQGEKKSGLAWLGILGGASLAGILGYSYLKEKNPNPDTNAKSDPNPNPDSPDIKAEIDVEVVNSGIDSNSPREEIEITGIDSYFEAFAQMVSEAPHMMDDGVFGFDDFSVIQNATPIKDVMSGNNELQTLPYDLNEDSRNEMEFGGNDRGFTLKIDANSDGVLDLEAIVNRDTQGRYSVEKYSENSNLSEAQRASMQLEKYANYMEDVTDIDVNGDGVVHIPGQ